MTSDAELLRRYAVERAEPAFSELVRRHLALVYSAALRQVGGDVHRAAEVTQAVFGDLARKAGTLTDRASLAGWLHTSTRFAATKVVRAEARRREIEKEAQAMPEQFHALTAGTDWARLKPLIDEAVQGLREIDREAVILRFFAGRSFAEIGAVLALSEDAARMRVERALEKLRALLARRGVTSTGAALGLVLAKEGAGAAPVGLAAAVTGGALAAAESAGAAAGLLSVAIRFMSTSKILAAGATVLATLAVGTAVHQINARRTMEETLTRVLREQSATAATRAAPTPSAASAAPMSARSDTDFHALAAQLRAAGFSEEVVRNVVGDVVGQHFKAQRRALGLEPAPLPSEFWKSPVVSASSGTPEEIAGRRALEQEQRQVLRGLFGADYDVSEDTRQRRAHGLPEATAAKLHQIFADYRDMEEQAREEAKGQAEVRAKLELLAKEKRADIERLLTPEQLLEFDLRMGAGNALHNRLGSFAVTEAEFRALYAAQKAFEASHPGLAPRDRNALFEPEINRVLGEARYAELLAANPKGAQQTGAFLELRAFVVEHDLPPAKASEVIRLQSQYQPQLSVIAQNPSLTVEQKAANRATLGAAARKELLRVLGPSAFEAYMKTRGGWLPPETASGAPVSTGTSP